MNITSRARGSSTATQSRALDFAAYNRIVGLAELANIALVEAKFRLTPEYGAASRDKGRAGKRKFLISGETTDKHFDPTGGIAGAMFSWSIRVQEGKAIHLEIDCKFLVVYRGLISQPKREAIIFLERVGKTACYPYLRAYVAQLNGLANIDLPPLPILREPPIRSSKASARAASAIARKGR